MTRDPLHENRLAGYRVTVVTCFPNFPRARVYEGYRNGWRCVEDMEGIRVMRVWCYIAANEGFMRKDPEGIQP